MDEFQPNYWHWWVLGFALLAVEMFFPGAIFLWMGISAGVVGVLVLAMPELGWKLQLGTFAVLSIVTVLLGRSYLRRSPIRSDAPTLNRRSQQFIGRVVAIEEPIVNGSGRIRIDDSTWRVTGPDCAAGTVVEIVAAKGLILTVRPKS